MYIMASMFQSQYKRVRGPLLIEMAMAFLIVIIVKILSMRIAYLANRMGLHFPLEAMHKRYF